MGSDSPREAPVSEAEDSSRQQQKDLQRDAFMAEVASWFEGKTFTTDWVTRKAMRWHRFLRGLRKEKADVLEVGTFEGRSAVFMLNYLPHARITCVDFFKGELDARFDTNLAPYGDRVTKLKGSAAGHLDALGQAQARYDLIYLDAGKRRDDALALSLLAWPLLKTSGIFIWDDYDWGLDRPPAERPHDGIATFLKLHEADYNLLWDKGQVFVQRVSPPDGGPGHSPHNPNLSY
ncbi:class I SAM-dependent methyltransferase [Aquabacter sp. L1I39]|uniref:O-methyltransferase n=1 Tax=Aquabacter sp. L1I39 TaxID=2820278 RepID=UPI001ADC092A|nr:class I SAM-dependent methyltransferase [Aquabacter sp. L1I39]QTL02148.1 class I SAM-dependent methyltransferase [Aquabacter sp. L1I39]